MDVNEFAVKFGAMVSEPGLSPETALDTLDGWDSLGQVTFIAFARRQFGTILNVEKMKSANTVSDLYNMVSGG